MATLRCKNGTYFADYRVNGRRIRKAVGRSKRIAELAVKDIEVKIAKGDLGFAKKDSDLKKIFEEFNNYSRTNHSPSSQKRYRAILDNFKSFLTHYPYIKKVSQLSPKTFEDFKSFRKEGSTSNVTINIELRVLRTIFNLAIDWGYAKENPTRGVKHLRESKKIAPRFLSDDECRTLLENSDEFMYPILYTFLYTGMRKGELENLEWKDVDFNRNKIKIRAKANWTPKTSEREIPINNGLVALLKKHKQKAKQGSLVFHRKGKFIDPSFLRKKFLDITKNCGFPDVTKIHTLRHTFASHLVMKGVDLPTVKKLMGHADIDTTMIYSHLADEHVDRAVEKLEF